MAAESALNMSALANLTDFNHTQYKLSNVNGVLTFGDGQWLYNMSRNDTIPWDHQDGMNGLIQQWMRLENLPGWLKIAKFIAYFLWTVSTILLRYPLWQVIGTMTIVEAPQSVIQVTATDTNNKKSDDVDDKMSTTISQTRATTSSLRASIRHVYRIAGVESFYRGTANAVCIFFGGIPCYMLFSAIVGKILRMLGVPQDSRFGNEIEETATYFLTMLVLVTWNTAHTHVLITQPTLRIWYRRLPPYRKTLKLVLPCIAAEILAEKITFDLPNVALKYAGVYKDSSYMGPNAVGSALLCRRLAFTAIWLLAQAARLGLFVPAQIVKIRVEASMLPDDEETIVPVDRTFGTAETKDDRPGYVPRGILAPPGEPIGMRKAWSTCTREEMKRILIMYAKFAAVELVMLCVFWLVLGNDVWPHFWHPKGSFF